MRGYARLYIVVFLLIALVINLVLQIIEFSGTGKLLLWVLGYYVILFGIPFIPIGVVWMLPTITGFPNLDTVISIILTIAYLIFLATYGLNKFRQWTSTETSQNILAALIAGPVIIAGLIFVLALLWAVISGVFGWLFAT